MSALDRLCGFPIHGVVRPPPPQLEVPSRPGFEYDMTRAEMVEALAEVVVDLRRPNESAYTRHDRVEHAVALIASCLAKELGGGDVVKAKLAADELSRPPEAAAQYPAHPHYLPGGIPMPPPYRTYDEVRKSLAESIARKIDEDVLRGSQDV